MIDARNATPAEMLEQRIMDPCAAKSEAEWWAHREIAKQRAEIERLRAMLPPTAHSGVRNGPGEGSWSVFAGKVVEERDAARAEIERQRAEIKRLREVLGGIRIDGPDADGLVWAIIQHPDIAARSRVAVYPVGKTIRYLCSNLPDGRILMEPEVEECAPELEQKRAEIERLRAALEYMVNVCPAIDPDGDRAHEQARAALEGRP